MKISDNRIEEAKAVDLVDIIGKDTALKRRGSQYVGCCPLHDEKTPSFYITPKKGFKCFGCDAKGVNAIDYLMLKGNEFASAVNSLTAGFVDAPGNDGQKRKQSDPNPLMKQPICLPKEVVEKRCLPFYKQNTLFVYFSMLFTEKIASDCFKLYKVGGARGCKTAFVQTDTNGNYRQVKLMLYNLDGHRNKQFNAEFIGKKILNNPGANLSQCLFGEHLINTTTKPIAIVESEKTALGMSILDNSFLWVATGGAYGLNKAKINALRNRSIILFPDVDKCGEWQETAKQNHWKCSTVMKDYAKNGENAKMDIWDVATQNIAANGVLLNEHNYPIIWDL